MWVSLSRGVEARYSAGVTDRGEAVGCVCGTTCDPYGIIVLYVIPVGSGLFQYAPYTSAPLHSMPLCPCSWHRGTPTLHTLHPTPPHTHSPIPQFCLRTTPLYRPYKPPTPPLHPSIPNLKTVLVRSGLNSIVPPR